MKKYPQEHIIQLGSFYSLSSCISCMHAGNGLVQLQTCRIISILSLRGPLIIRSSPILDSGKPLSPFPSAPLVLHSLSEAGARKYDTVSLAQQADVATAIHYDSETLTFLLLFCK